MNIILKVNDKRFMCSPISEILPATYRQGGEYVVFLLSHTNYAERYFDKFFSGRSYEFMYECSGEVIRVECLKSCLTHDVAQIKRPMSKPRKKHTTAPAFKPIAYYEMCKVVTREVKANNYHSVDFDFVIFKVMDLGTEKVKKVVYKCKDKQACLAAFRCYAHHKPIYDEYMEIWK